jgi:putative ABC transport system permease protein
MSALRIIIGLAWRDLRHDRAGLITQVLALAAVLTPLLVLYSLRVGVIGTLVAQMAEDPRNRQIVVVQQGHYPAAFFDRLRADPRTAFVVGHASPIASEMEFAKGGGPGLAASAHGVVLGSGPGDPLLPRGVAAPLARQAVVSRGLATRLKLSPGDTMVLSASRIMTGREEALDLPLTVTGFIDPALFSADGALLADETLAAVERWRDGFAVAAFGASGQAETHAFAYRNFRLYAADLAGLKALTLELQGEGVPVQAPRLKDYENIMSLNAALGTIFVVIAGAAGMGFLLSFGANQWGNVARKRRSLSVLRLHGLSRRATSLFPMTQAMVISAIGWGAAVIVYLLTAQTLNEWLAPHLALTGVISRLDVVHLAAAGGFTLLASSLASLSAAWRVMEIDPGEGIHGD